MINFETKKLKEICKVNIGRTPPRKESLHFSKEKGVKWASILDISNSEKYIYKTNEYLTNEAIKKFKIPLVEKRTILLSFKLSVGKIAITKDKMTSNEAIAHLNFPKIDVDYLYYYLKFFNYKTIGNTSSIANAVNSNIIKNLNITYPNIKNQKFISSFLSLVDKKIENNMEIIFLLNELINVKFKKIYFNNSSKTFPIGKVITRKKNRVKNEKLIILTATKESKIVKSEDYFHKQVFSKNISNYVKIDKNDFAFNPSRINIGSIGMNKFNFTGAVSPAYIVFGVKKPFEWYFEKYLNLNKTKKIIKSLCIGSVRQSLDFDDFKNILINIPNESIVEEFNVYNSLIENKIHKLNTEIELLKKILNNLGPNLIKGKFIKN